MACDLQGRLLSVTTVADSTTTVTQYAYDAEGVRVKQTVTVDAGTPVVTEYLIDKQNLTGYAKAIREVVDSVVARDYTIGPQIISQQDGTGTPVFYAHDGHGSTRVLTNLAGAVATYASTPQVFHYTAFGDPHGFAAANALTTWLFAGDGQRDPSTGMTYHLARWRQGFYFLGLDPFVGNHWDPQSFHKHLYAHGDPANFNDPTGLVAMGLGGLAAMSIVMNTTISNLTIGGLIVTSMATFGASGNKVRNLGIELAAQGNIELGLALHELGGEIFGLGAHLVEVSTAAIEAFSFGIAAVGLIRAGVNLADSGLSRITELFRNLRSHPGGLTTAVRAAGRLGGKPLSPAGFDALKAILGAVRSTKAGNPLRVSFQTKPANWFRPGVRGEYQALNLGNGSHMGIMRLADDATIVESQHELQHLLIHVQMGDDYHNYSKAAHEFAVFRRLQQSPVWKTMTQAERRNANDQIYLNNGPDPSLWNVLTNVP